MSVVYIERQKTLTIQESLIPIFLAISFCVVFLRLWYLQVVQAEELTERARIFHQTIIQKEAPRGLILDCNGELIAGVKSEMVVTAIPAIAKKNPMAVKEVADLLGMPLKKIERKLSDAYLRPYHPAPISINPPVEVATKIAESANKYSGFGVESFPMRYYPDPVSFSHILGYVWTPSEKEVNRIQDFGRKPASYVGKSGLEYYYEKDLMGRPGCTVMDVNVHRKPLKIVTGERIIPGTKLVLGIHAELQKLATKLMKEYQGAVVALDPQNGEVLCMVSSPAYDASQFLHGISNKNWLGLMNDQRKPLMNRAIRYGYPPASTAKIVTAMASMKQGTYNPAFTYHCPGAYYLGRRRVRCMGVHGSPYFNEAMAHSCNVYFSALSVKIGGDYLCKTFKECGIGQLTGIDIGAEYQGILPDDEWLQKWRKPPVRTVGDVVNMGGLGQGELEGTALQEACFVSLVANRGISYKPHFLKKKIFPDQPNHPEIVEQEILHRFSLPEEKWDILQRAMVSVIDKGTARRARIPGLEWAGKTGTAQHVKGQPCHGLFVGYAPLKNPKIAIAVITERTGCGGTVSAPIAKEIVQKFLNLDS